MNKLLVATTRGILLTTHTHFVEITFCAVQLLSTPSSVLTIFLGNKFRAAHSAHQGSHLADLHELQLVFVDSFMLTCASRMEFSVVKVGCPDAPRIAGIIGMAGIPGDSGYALSPTWYCSQHTIRTHISFKQRSVRCCSPHRKHSADGQWSVRSC